MKPPEAIQPLVDLGFTELEASVYLCLLQESPLTGYAVAKAIGKPTANTYRAMETLAHKGAVMFDDGERRLCRALGPSEVLGRLERDFAARKRRAQRAVSRLPRHRDDQRIYQLRTSSQVFDRARQMLGAARRIVMVDAFPAPLERLAEALVETAERGVLVCVHAYREAHMPAVEVRTSEIQHYALEAWPGAHLSVAADAEQHLYALLSHDLESVTQAVWSGSLYLSCMAHNHLAVEFEFAEYRQRHPAAATALPIHLVRNRLPGFERLRSQTPE